VQFTAPARLNVPVRHAVQFPAPAALYLPAVQIVQLAEATPEKFPAAQLVQVEAYPPALIFPAGHAEQTCVSETTPPLQATEL
jgi:hypothetical protein